MGLETARAAEGGAADIVLEGKELAVDFPVPLRPFGRQRHGPRALDAVDIALKRGTTLGLAGESGSGKTTLGRVLAGLLEPTSGAVRFHGTLGAHPEPQGYDVFSLRGPRLRHFRRRVQIIFQDPFDSLNPRARVGSIVGEPLRVHGLASGDARRTRVAELFRTVGLDPACVARYPHEFSGGQRQRIAIARAIAVGPQVVIADEPVSSLDVSIRAQIINLLLDLQEQLGLTYLFVAHDLELVGHISTELAVMYTGRIVELGVARAVCDSPLHPYTQMLLQASRLLTGRAPTRSRRGELGGSAPCQNGRACPFHPRCWQTRPVCLAETPPLRQASPDHWVACHFPGR